jgi:hypothetical protein
MLRVGDKEPRKQWFSKYIPPPAVFCHFGLVRNTCS